MQIKQHRRVRGEEDLGGSPPRKPLRDSRVKAPDPSYRGDANVLFAAERNLLAWGRSGIAMMGFGFVVERFGLFLHLTVHAPEGSIHRSVSLGFGVGLLLMGALAHLVGMQQFVHVLRTVGSGAVPPGYWRHAVMWFSAAQIVVAATLSVYFMSGV